MVGLVSSGRLLLTSGFRLLVVLLAVVVLLSIGRLLVVLLALAILLLRGLVSGLLLRLRLFLLCRSLCLVVHTCNLSGCVCDYTSDSLDAGLN